MSSHQLLRIQDQSAISCKKIQKKHFTCSECFKIFQSYTAYHSHQKNSHKDKDQSIKILTSNEFRKVIPKFIFGDLASIDLLPLSPVEGAQEQLLSFLGEKLKGTSFFDTKPTFRNIIYIINQIPNSSKDSCLSDIKNRSQEFYEECKDNHLKELYFDFDSEFVFLDQKDSLLLLVWIIFWLSKYYVKDSIIPNICLIFSKIWKVMKENNLTVKNLEDEVLWEKVGRECELVIKKLKAFREDKNLVDEFVIRICRLISASLSKV